MSGSILENMSGRKLGMILAAVLTVLVFSFFLGGVIAPSPSHADQILGTVCAQEKPTVAGDTSWEWAIPRAKRNLPHNCKIISSLDEISQEDRNVTANHIIFAFQIPLPKERMQLDYSRWMQNLVGVLQLEITYNKNNPLKENPVLDMDIKMGYRNKHDHPETWYLLANSTETRTLKCDLNSTEQIQGHAYNCDVLNLFELGSLHHDYYLINIKFPINEKQTINAHLGHISDVWLIAIHQNGGFTKVWFSLKAFFFPIVLVTMLWYWRRIRILERPPILIEGSLLAVAIAMTLLNLPLEFLTLKYDMPYMLLICDIRQGIFYATLFSFWLIFCGEHLMDDVERNRLSSYWKDLAFVITGCTCMFIFDMCERGAQLINPFYSIWATDIGNDLALGFIILAGCCVGFYILHLFRLVYKVVKNISCKRSALPAMSQTRRMYYEGIIYRFKFLLLATTMTAALTGAAYIMGQVSEGRWKWDEEMTLQFPAAFFTGVYGMWNCYVFMLLVLYAPSHKYKNQQSPNDINTLTSDDNQDSIEFSRLTASDAGPSCPPADEGSSLADFAKKVALD